MDELIGQKYNLTKIDRASGFTVCVTFPEMTNNYRSLSHADRNGGWDRSDKE